MWHASLQRVDQIDSIFLSGEVEKLHFVQHVPGFSDQCYGHQVLMAPKPDIQTMGVHMTTVYLRIFIIIIQSGSLLNCFNFWGARPPWCVAVPCNGKCGTRLLCFCSPQLYKEAVGAGCTCGPMVVLATFKGACVHKRAR